MKLSAWAPTVNQSMSMSLLPSGLRDDVIPERICEYEYQRDHETVDGHGFDHRQADEQRTGNGGGGVGLLGQRGQSRRYRAPFARLAGRCSRWIW